MNCLIDKTEQKTFHVFPKKALFNKPIKTPVSSAVADMHLCYNPVTGHISSHLDSKMQTSDLLKTIYTEIYDSYAPAGLSGLQKQFSEFVSKWLLANMPKNSKILEIGCHDGFMLNEFKQQGHTCVGVEPSPYGKYAVEKYGLDVKNEFFTEGMFEDETFDVIILRHVVEHVPDPVAFVQSATKVLKKGGIAYIEVPNSQWSLENFYFPEFHVDHISYFTMNSLTRLLKLAGLNKIIHKEAFKAYMKFPFLMSLSIKEENSMTEKDLKSNFFLNFSVNETINEFTDNFSKYVQSLKDLKSYNKIAVWGSGSIGTQYAIDGNFGLDNVEYVDPNKISQGLKLSVTGHLINSPEILKDYNPDILIIASGWEHDSIIQSKNYISSKTKTVTFNNLLEGKI